MKLTIITINYNNAAGLQRTVDSVLLQTYADFEFIIVDGASTDGSKQILEHLQQEKQAGNILFPLTIISEPDAGIYNAMNKGIRLAKGEYCLFLNSGDCLAVADTLQNVSLETFMEDIVYGIQLVEKDNQLQPCLSYAPEDISFRNFIHSSLPHQCTFIRRELFTNVGLYNENNKIVSDWEFNMLALFKYNVSLKKITVPIAVYDTTGISSNPEYKLLQEKEKQQVLECYFPRIMRDVIRQEQFEQSKTYRMVIRLKQLFQWMF